MKTGRPKPGRPKGTRNGESRTAQAVLYMHEHRVSVQEAARRFRVYASAVTAAIRSGTYDEHGRYVGHDPKDSVSGQAALYVKSNNATLREAAKRFGITHQAVQQAWVRVFPEEPLPSRLLASLRVQQMIEYTSTSNGRTIREVAEEFDMTCGAARTICVNEGIATRPASEVTAEQNEQIVAEVMKGERTIPESAAEFDVSPGHAGRLLTDRGLRVPHRFGGNYNRGKSAEAFELMKREHLSVQDAAQRLRIAPGSLRSYIKRQSR